MRIVGVIVALVIQHAMRMRRIIFSPVACQDVHYFSMLSKKLRDFRGGGGGDLLNTKCVFSVFSTNLVKHFSFHELSDIP
jgi:hypothetical protein